MKSNPILEEVWRLKDKLLREMAADPDAYFAKLDEITSVWVTPALVKGEALNSTHFLSWIHVKRGWKTGVNVPRSWLSTLC